jgi:hypothetical protein
MIQPDSNWIYTLGGGLADSMYFTSGGLKTGFSVRCIKD